MAACSSRAQVTNSVVFHAVSINQGFTTNNGTVTTFAPPKTEAANNAKLLGEIGKAMNVNGTGSFTAAAKLVLITANGGGTPIFAVIDGANFYDLSSNPGGSNIMNISIPLEIQVTSGTESDSTVQEKKTQRIPLTIIYDDTPDTGAGNVGNLMFNISGIVTVSETRTAPVNNVYTDTLKGKISMSGGGSSGGNPFVATATFVFGGSAKLLAL